MARSKKRLEKGFTVKIISTVYATKSESILVLPGALFAVQILIEVINDVINHDEDDNKARSWTQVCGIQFSLHFIDEGWGKLYSDLCQRLCRFGGEWAGSPLGQRNHSGVRVTDTTTATNSNLNPTL